MHVHEHEHEHEPRTSRPARQRECRASDAVTPGAEPVNLERQHLLEAASRRPPS